MTDRQALSRKLIFRLRGAVDGEEADLLVREGESLLGSSPTCDLRIPSRSVSRRHVVLRCTADQLTVQDLGSTNGTWVNGVRIEEAQVRPGDTLRLGSVQLSVDRVTGADGVLALPAPAPPGRTRAREADVERSSTAAAEPVPQRWIEGLARIAELTHRAHAPDPGAVLAALRSALGASATVLVRLRAGSPPGVLGSAGVLPEALLDLGELALDRAPSDRVKAVLHDGGQLLAAARVCEGAGSHLLMAALGDFPQRAASGRMLEAALHLCLALVPDPTPPPVRVRQPIEDLTLPAGVVAGESPAITALYRELRVLARGDISVLITGETGVGKEVVARILHLSSRRRHGPFVALNCAAIPAELLEAELFGIERGVATGVEPRPGKVQAANEGVLFLDEVGDLSPAAQAKLLRVLQEREVHPVGASRPRPVDIRVLAATNANLMDRVGEGLFRPDLFHRIAGTTVQVPSLRERREDIPLLVHHMLRRHAAAAGLAPGGVTWGALKLLRRAPWPGNIRELDNEVQRLALACPAGQPITARLVSPAVAAATSGQYDATERSDLDLRHRIRALETELVLEALRRAEGNGAHAARLLGLTRQGLSQALKRLGIATADALA
ncbi:MAG: sigma 54-interacting transcriptional regulator [Thermoanaerobaculaceae bacterium]